MRRVVAEGGRVAISVWRALQLHPLYQALFQRVARHLHAPIETLDVSSSVSDADELRRLLGDAGFRDVKVDARSLDVRLPTSERFVQLTVLGAATSVPAFMRLDEATRSALVETVARETVPVVQRYRDGRHAGFSNVHAHNGRTRVAIRARPGCVSERSRSLF